MKPRIAFPMLITSAILGALAGVFNIQGTPYSAGFGLSGLVGPLNYINLTDTGWTMGNISIMVSVFFIIPVMLNYALIYIFSKKYQIITNDDYKLDFE